MADDLTPEQAAILELLDRVRALEADLVNRAARLELARLAAEVREANAKLRKLQSVVAAQRQERLRMDGASGFVMVPRSPRGLGNR